MTSTDRVVEVWRCGRDECGKTSERAAGSSPPACGSLHTDYDESRFPDGSWVQIQTRHYEHHGAMVATGELLVVNPFQALVDEGAELRRARFAKRDV